MIRSTGCILSWCLFVMVLLPCIARAESPGSTSYSQLVLDDIKTLESKFTDLARTIPSEHFSWRPNEHARSVSEVFTHVASASYFYTQHLGTPIPKGAFRGHRNLEELTTKEDAVSVLVAAFEHTRNHVTEHGAEPQMTSFHMLVHLHEHLGQAIAYARSLGIKPPWSADRDSQ